MSVRLSRTIFRAASCEKKYTEENTGYAVVKIKIDLIVSVYVKYDNTSVPGSRSSGAVHTHTYKIMYMNSMKHMMNDIGQGHGAALQYVL